MPRESMHRDEKGKGEAAEVGGGQMGMGVRVSCPGF